ncbi:protein ALP1-like isoform X1 [Medicago truncatula]|uniref:protein ALP1-like isoform X1 n=1 Tax=Medicago truncatula TaxID=3880 RepID=UPI000D2F3E3D|nr:protein ALP1-like isoform X1 [Medicago truncatula]XP_039689895.1 protein ALP1-like isoform X1 [Medicago truncatula]
MDNKRENKRRKYAFYWNIRSSAIGAIATYYYKYIYKEPCMTSLQRGQDWMNEILNGHPVRCMNAFRMDPTLFKQLCEDLQSKYGLQPSKRMTVEEKVGIFVYTLAMGASNRDVRERFQHSGETISRAFHEVLEAISGRSRGYRGLARDIIRPKDPTFQFIPLHISNDERYMTYFKDCIGCIDGTHIAACIPEADQMRYRGRKGIPTFNVMACCDFDMCFTFISVGWEGSAHDTRVFLHAINTPALNFPKPPDGRYYLVDKGYPDKEGYMVPYPRIRYHQSQFEHEPPTNAQEAFNQAHSSLRSCIERSFGVLKKRWKILNKMPQFSVKTQIDVIIAAFALHNYIRINSQDDAMFTILERHPNYIPNDELPDIVDGYQGSERQEGRSGRSTKTKEMRNNVAALLWNIRR